MIIETIRKVPGIKEALLAASLVSMGACTSASNADGGASASPSRAAATAGAKAAGELGSISCDVMAITSLPARPDANVNGIPVRLQVRDINDCARGLFYNETGVAKGTNYTVDLPSGWSVITASVTAAVHREGGKQKDYLDTPELVINGPFKGGVGLYEGSFRVVPTEWVKPVSEFVLPIQRAETKKPTLPITVYTD